MTLLEAVVALIIAGSAVVGYLGVFASGLRAMADRDARVRAVACAEATMEEVKVRGAARASELSGMVDGCRRTVEVRPGAGHLVEVVVRASVAAGDTVEVRRLVGGT